MADATVESTHVGPQEVAANSALANSVKSFVSGGFGGMCLVAAGHPLDLIKVRLQASTQYTGMVDCLRKTIAKDGVRGLYRGMAAPLIGITPIYAVCFWGYDLGKRISQKFYGQDYGSPLTIGQICFAGGFSALPATVLMTPIERVKCILQIQATLPDSQAKYAGPLDAAKGIWREGGIRGLYKGTTATLLRDGPGSVAYFGAYEFFKRTFTPAGKGPEDLSPVAVFCAGGLAGMANWSVAIPADVLKSRQQTAPPGTYTGLTDVFVKLIRNEGPKALFRGLGPAMLRAFPANAACFLGVEVSLKVINSVF